MSTSAVSRNYAATLFELAGRDGSEERYGELIRDVARLYETDGAFRRFLNAPSITATEKKEVVRRALESAASDLFIRFLMVLLDRRRQSALPGIAEDYRRLVDGKRGRIRPIVTLPSEPDEALKATIVAALERRFEQKVVPEFRVDRNILGGVVVRAGDHLFDASIRRQLKELKRELL